MVILVGGGGGGRGAGEELLASVQETCSTRTRERHGDSFEGKKGGKGARWVEQRGRRRGRREEAGKEDRSVMVVERAR